MDESSDRHRRCHSCCLTAPSLTSRHTHLVTLVTSRRSGRWTLLQDKARRATNTGGGGGKDRVGPTVRAAQRRPPRSRLARPATRRDRAPEYEKCTNVNKLGNALFLNLQRQMCTAIHVYLADVFLSMMSSNLLTGGGTEQIYRTLRLTALFVLLTLSFNFLFPCCCSAFHEPDNW